LGQGDAEGDVVLMGAQVCHRHGWLGHENPDTCLS
jgi:hypothetical protein